MTREEVDVLLREFGRAFERVLGKPARVQAWHVDNFRNTLEVRFAVPREAPPAPVVVPQPHLSVTDPDHKPNRYVVESVESPTPEQLAEMAMELKNIPRGSFIVLPKSDEYVVPLEDLRLASGRESFALGDVVPLPRGGRAEVMGFCGKAKLVQVRCLPEDEPSESITVKGE